MRQFSFETNIQERMPWNGKVFYVKRMTSDYAECFPFNVDQFIEDVYQKYVKMAEEDPYCRRYVRTREELHLQWVKTLSVTRQSGDASIYPNRDGRQEPALMEVWQKAGDYWARGLRIGDTLPKVVPPCRITRLPEGGWIALFPKEMHLLESRPETTEPTEMALAFDDPQAEDESNLPKIDGGDDAANDFDEPNLDLNLTTMNDVTTVETVEVSAVETSECEAEHSVLNDDTDGDGQQCDTDVTCGVCPIGVGEVQVREQGATGINASAGVGIGVTPAPEPFVSQREILAERRHQRRLERERMQRSYEERMEREAREAEQAACEEQRRNIFAAVGAVAVTAVMIYFFGLLGPAVFGLLCGGLLKG